MLEDHLNEDQLNTVREAQRAGTLNREQKARILELAQTPATKQIEPEGSPEFSGLGRGPLAFSDDPEFSAMQRDASRATTIEEMTGGVITPGVAEMAGGTMGAAAGIPAGPVGVAGGGALGTAMGRLAFDTFEDFLQMTGGLKMPEEGEDFFAPTERALKAAKDDLLFAGGAHIVGEGLVFTKPLIGKVLGVRQEDVVEISKQADAAGLKVGAVDIMTGVRGKIARGSAKVLGIFPLLGTPFRTHAREKGEILVSQIDNTLNRLAPNAVMADDLGIDMTRAARNSIKEFRDIAATNYDKFRRLAENASSKDIIPTKPIKGAVGLLVKRAEDSRILLETEEALKGPANDAFEKFIGDLKDLPDHISMQQYEGLTDNLKDFVKKANADGFDIKRFMGIKKAMEMSLNKLKVSRLKPGEGEALIQAKKTADAFFSKGIVDFQTPTAQKFARVDKNIFKPGFKKEGTLNADEIAGVVFNVKSPQAARDLAKLVGKEQMGRGVRKHVENVFDSARLTNEAGEIIGMNWAKLKNDFGITGKSPEKKAALKAMMGATNVSLAELENIINIASKIVVPKDVNTFIARRAALGGFSSMLAGATAGNLIKDSKIKSIGVALLVRNFTKILSSPTELRAMQKVLSPEITGTQRRLLFGRLLEALDTNLEREKTAPEIPEDE